jgi:hypothetical protein
MSNLSTLEPVRPEPPQRPIHRNPWPLALVIMALGLVAAATITFVALRMLNTAARLIDTPTRVAASLAAAFQPNVTVSTLLTSTIGKMHSHPKLVVLTTQIDAEVAKASNTTWVGINFGTTSVRVRAHENKVQYYIPLQGLQTSNFVFDPARKKLVVRVPAPRLDEELVDVQSDPSKIDVETRNGWAKLDAYSGAPLREAAKRELRPAVLAAGRHILMQHEAENRGKESLRNLLQPISDALRPEVELDIEFFSAR